MSFELFDEVPDAKSSRSTSAVRKPRLAASSATPTPVMPPPMTSTSKRSPLRRFSMDGRSNGTGDIGVILGGASPRARAAGGSSRRGAPDVHGERPSQDPGPPATRQTLWHG